MSSFRSLDRAFGIEIPKAKKSSNRIEQKRNFISRALRKNMPKIEKKDCDHDMGLRNRRFSAVENFSSSIFLAHFGHQSCQRGKKRKISPWFVVIEFAIKGSLLGKETERESQSGEKTPTTEIATRTKARKATFFFFSQTFIGLLSRSRNI